ncbi:ABC transporter substrate-binding protein [Diaminobutyricimonas aerilata]|nr:extracellular solute-binding protein [Diaminobutyricimonas aerilata]
MRSLAVLGTAAALAAGVLTGCAGGSGGGSDSQDLTFWHNSTTGPGKAFWEEAAAAFEAENEDVKITVQSIQNEDMDGKLQTALNSGDAPDIFLARGGGKLADVVRAGQAKDLTDLISDETREAVGEATLKAFSVDGKVYGMPIAVLPGGIYYNTALFEQAGITAPPTTIDELGEAVDKLKAAGIQPIALGGKDAWPAAHWYYFFALRECSPEVMEDLASEVSFEDECWSRAGDDLEEFVGTEPFNEGFLTTTAQQGAGSSAGLIANSQAAMELMGAWNPGVISSLTPDQKPLPTLAWFPFPAVESGEGDPAAMMGGVDGYACHVDAPSSCEDFLNFVMQQEYQEKYAQAFVTLPASQEAQSVVTEPALQDVLAAYNEAPYVTVWLDTLFGQNVGNALNAAVVDLLAGKGGSTEIIEAVNSAVKKG